MKIIILGTGHVGSALACTLAAEENDITLVDVDASQLLNYQSLADLKTIVGNPSDPETLKNADAENADMLIAVTASDETNMIACQVAHTIFNIPTKIARIYGTAYFEYPQLFSDTAIPVDVVIRPEQLVSENICRLIKYPGALQIVEFAHGRLLLVGIKAEQGGHLVGKCLQDIPAELPDTTTRIAAIYRSDKHTVTPDGDTRIEAGDEIFFIATEEHVRSVMRALNQQVSFYSRIFIAGGGRIGMCLAQLLMQDYQVKLIERNEERTQLLSEKLDKVVILHGDATNEEILVEENVDKIDMFCAVTSDDEDNILSAMLAKHLGARKTLSLISRPKYVDLIHRNSIDIALSPQMDAVSAILRHLRKGDVVKAYSLRHGAAEAIEAIARGDEQSSNVVGRKINEISLPAGATISAIVRGEQVLMSKGNIMIQSDDHVILFVDNRRWIPEIEKLFQVSASFF